MRGKKIFITGGAGYLGRNLIRKYYDDNELTVYSRDEAKHYYLKREFPRVNFIVGDVRNYDLLKRSSAGHNIGIFAASLKQISAVDQNVEESIEVIIKGALNSRRVSEENGFEAACFISSDKSRAATTLYGSMKFVAGESFIVNSTKTDTRLSSIVYGNVINSTGSIIPLIWEALNRGWDLPLYSREMTRYMIDIKTAILAIERGLQLDGCNVIPNLRSFRVSDLFDVYREEFNLKYHEESPRVSEKLHEMLMSNEESRRSYYDAENNMYILHYEKVNPEIKESFELTSDSLVMSKDELYTILRSYNFFRP